MTDTFVIYGGKKVRMEDLPPDAWKYLTGGNNADTGQNLYGVVATLYRCVTARADAAASIPFRIETQRGKVIETSDDWKDGMGWMPHPKAIIRQMFMSADFTNAAYALKLRNKYKIAKGLQYFVPTSVTPVPDKTTGELSYFERIASNGKKEYTPDELLYVWYQDAFTEFGPSQNSPVRAALTAANIMNNLGQFVSVFFEQGAIDPIIGAIPRDTQKDERERAENLLNQVMTGIKNAFKIRLISTEDVKLQPLRQGLDSLKKTELTKEQREEISIAMTVPLSFLLGDQANYATASQEEKNIIRWGVVPRLEVLFEAINEQIYKPEGYKLVSDYKALEAFQEDEEKRSQTLSNFLDAVSKAKDREQLKAALSVLKYEISDEEIDKLVPEKKEDPQTPDTQQPIIDTSNDTPNDNNQRAVVELDKWMEKTIKAGKPITWHVVNIPIDIADNINDRLQQGHDIKSVFRDARLELTGQKPTKADAIAVLEGLRLAIENAKRSE